jgi:hypothetical protein
MSFIKMTSNNKGISLLELLVGIGLIGGISFALLKMGDTNLKTTSKADLDQDVNIITSRIQMILSNKDNCTATLKQTPINSVIQMVERNGTKSSKVILQAKEFNLPPDQRTFHSKSGVSIKEMSLASAPRGQILKVKMAAFRPSNGEYLEVSGTEHIREFPIIQNPADGSCYTELSSQDIIRDESRKIACMSMNGTYIEAEQKCAPTNLPVCIYGDVNGGGCGGSEIYTKLVTFKLLGPGNTVVRMDKCCRLPVAVAPLPPMDPPVEDEDENLDTLPCDQSIYVPIDPEGVRCPVCGEPNEPASCPQCGVPGKPACPPPPCGTAGQPACPPPPCGTAGQPACPPPPCGTAGQPACPPPPCGTAGQPACPPPVCGTAGQPACPPPACGTAGQPACPIDCTPVNGGWSDYSWVDTCPAGNKVGTRTCTNPAPNSCGVACSGPETLTEVCSCTPSIPCDVLKRMVCWEYPVTDSCGLYCGMGDRADCGGSTP